MEEPRSLKPEEMKSVERLVDVTFMYGNDGFMRRNYPTMFNLNNIDNLIVSVDEGRVVSHVGMTERWATLAGCTVRVASIGAVATYEEYRGKGLGTILFDKSIAKAKADGVDFMLISGDRGLYRRPGGADAGCDYLGTVDLEAAKALQSNGLEVFLCSAENIPECAAAYDTRYARFVRTADDWYWLFKNFRCMDCEINIIGVRKNGVFRGYFGQIKPDDKGHARIVEVAGDPVDLAGAVHAAMELSGAKTASFELQDSDSVLKSALESKGVNFKAIPCGNIVLILNFNQLMTRLYPFFESKLGIDDARKLEFTEDVEAYTLKAGDDAVTVNRAEATQIIFGHPQPKALPGLLAKAFPVPCLWYGLNYI